MCLPIPAATSAQNSLPTRSANAECQSDTRQTRQDNKRHGDQQNLSDEILVLARSLRSAPLIDIQTGTQTSAKRPRFGDLSRYAISNEDEDRLWEIEAARLIDGLRATQETFNPGQRSALPATIDSSGFACLERLSDQMLCALSICGLDDNAVLEAHRSTGSSPNGSIVGRSFKKLETRLGSRPETHRVNQARRAPLSREPAKLIWSGGVPQKAPLPMAALDDADAMTYYHLVDYITVTLARLLSTGFTRHQIYWLGIIVNVLAKFSTKLKVLSHDLRTFAVEVVQMYDNLRMCHDLHKFSAADNQSDISLDMEMVRTDKVTGSSDSYLADYISDMGVVSNWLFRLAWHILTDLNTRNTRGRGTDEFEISATVFSAGSRGLSTLAYQNRPGHISGSSSSVAVGMYHRAFEIMTNTAMSIRKSPAQGAQMVRLSQSKLSIGAGKSFPDQTFTVRSMADLISIMVVFSCMDPTVTEGIVTVCNTIRASTVLPTVYSTVQDYASFASLCNIPLGANRPALRDSRPLSESFILHSGNRMFSDLRDRENTPWSWSFNAISQKELHTSETMRRRISASARGWAVEEQAISVSCLKYTISVMTGCAILVLGGLMAGFFVGSRIDGVDPFNLTMFAWIIAAFIIVVCKSLRVAEWTWRDFLKGRVTCRSVRELASVTNLDEQGIIMHLLSSENELPLKLRGPYNSVFANDDSEGFSVDIKPKMGTLFVSGLIILEVLTEGGSALVCLDLRSQVITDDGQINAAMGRRRIVHGQHAACLVLACTDPTQEGEVDKDITFRWKWLSWEKVVGLYNNPSQNVR
ncbi:hypothetical protein NW752_009430 [Fusarium irregulare]|uniref:Uncharacterized protein n=1 Tax=Fusarium irregulare TaxID=2494466 RepID=A0A9W8PEI0_9HYPO|nr:hypothetical protein NW766_012708 [Fusarium irregulare]KAJ4009133.1 hypothetical protein NW752_009430 [Fusarium irregulare]